MPEKVATEKDFLIRDVQLRVKHWHSDASINVIALHGWLDNAGSFDLLAQHLPDCSIAAIDLAGQGFSAARPASALYHLWDDLIDIVLIADRLGWDDFFIVGHSRGAMLAFLLAATYPERVKGVVALDALMPLPFDVNASVKQLRSFISDSITNLAKPFAHYQSQLEALQARAKASRVDLDVIKPVAVRHLRESSQGWFWQVDNRLKSASAFKMTEQQIQVILTSIKSPSMSILASDGLGAYPDMKRWQEHFLCFEWHEVKGHHHFHLDPMSVEEIACLCIHLLQR